MAPILILVLIILFFEHRGKPFFLQDRPGKDEKIFRIIKLKTMTDKTDPMGRLLPNERRLTMFGTIMRKSSFDEIPQLINVVKGEMSLVGPRPLRVHYLPYYTEMERIRHSVRPGITGLAQVSGRNSLSWRTRLALDIEYVQTLSFFGDLKIILKTVAKIFQARDVDFDQNMPDLDEERINEAAPLIFSDNISRYESL